MRTCTCTPIHTHPHKDGDGELSKEEKTEAKKMMGGKNALRAAAEKKTAHLSRAMHAIRSRLKGRKDEH